MEILAGGSLRVTDDGTGDGLLATGLWHVRTSTARHDVDAVLTLPSERYVAAVVNAEAAPGEPAESLRALAILARTYALNGTHFSPSPGHLPADLCDSTQCQAMRFGAVPASIEEATRATAGETLWFHGRRAEVYFGQSCGGVTEDGRAVWPRLDRATYLRSHADPYCVRRDSAAWHAEVPMGEFMTIAHAEGWRLPTAILSARIGERSASGRAVRLRFTGSDGMTAEVAASTVRFGIGRALGWNRVRSDLYEVAVRHGALIFDGRGHGHGVGLCQSGAAEMAGEGRGSRAILEFYFPGTRVGITPTDVGWRGDRVGELRVFATESRTPAQMVLLKATWSEAQRRFPPHRRSDPEVVFAPTTELFRQLTDEPGWALASTRASTIVLQPMVVLEAHGHGAGATLLHEMLHVLVEAESGERTPIWLREGLVEMLAGETMGTKVGEQRNAEEIDASLLGAKSLEESERAHRSAAARVQALIERYGMGEVRGWLASGVPAGVV